MEALKEVDATKDIFFNPWEVFANTFFYILKMFLREEKSYHYGRQDSHGYFPFFRHMPYLSICGRNWNSEQKLE